MSDLRDLGQRHLAALWDAVVALDGDTGAVVERLDGLVGLVDEVEAQLAGLRLHLLQEATLSSAGRVIEGVRQSVRHTPAQATAAIRLAADVGDRFPMVGSALSEGRISLAQAEAIVAGLRKLPPRLTRTELVECQREILAHVDALGPSELRVLASRLVGVVDPDGAEADDAKRLVREQASAHRARFLRVSPDHHGSMRISGQLPLSDAALLSAQLDALMPPASSYQHTGEIPSRDARRADALVLLTQAAASAGDLPAHGLDRPQVHITLDLDTLTTGLGRAGLIGAGDGVDGLSAGEARRLACDAGLIPMVLGGASKPLDVGRTNRLFTPAVRAALVQRDQGCVFPGCTAQPATCEAHHIVPWWRGGDTRFDNGVLLCPYHHRVVEPDPQQSKESQWGVHLDEVTGLSWFTPPRHIDPARRPRQHQRHRLQQLRPAGAAPPCPHAEPPQPESRDEDPPSLEELIQRSAAIWSAQL